MELSNLLTKNRIQALEHRIEYYPIEHGKPEHRQILDLIQAHLHNFQSDGPTFYDAIWEIYDDLSDDPDFHNFSHQHLTLFIIRYFGN